MADGDDEKTDRAPEPDFYAALDRSSGRFYRWGLLALVALGLGARLTRGEPTPDRVFECGLAFVAVVLLMLVWSIRDKVAEIVRLGADDQRARSRSFGDPK